MPYFRVRYLGQKTEVDCQVREPYLMHYGISGMKWGVRRYQEEGVLPNSQSGRIIKTTDHRTKNSSQSGKVIRTTDHRTKNSGQSEKVVYTKDARTKKEDKFGRYGKGNIDLNNRKVVHNKDGSISTERSFSVNIDGKETLLPTVINGRIVSEDEAIDHYYKTGEHLGRFDTIEEADAYAEELHNRQNEFYGKKKNNSPKETIKVGSKVLSLIMNGKR